MIEAMVAGGPRKSNRTYKEYGSELCEDCAGYRSVGHFTIFWLCDGTSNSSEVPRRSYLPGFNARTLAEDLGACFAKTMAKSVATTTVTATVDVQKDVGDEVAQEWQERLIEYIAEIKTVGKFEQLLDAMPQMIDGFYRLKWSSTFLGGVYNEWNVLLIL